MNKSFFKSYFCTTIFVILVYLTSLSTYADTKKESDNCLVYAEIFNKAKHTKNVLFVDVRDNTIFNKKHIAGSINIHLQLISTKAFLKNKNIVLVGNGWNETSLVGKCKQLKNKGFKTVNVLAGGIVSWFKKQKTLSKRPLISLTSKEFFNNKIEKKFVPVVILNKAASKNTKKQINTIMPHSKIFSSKEVKEKLLNGLNRLGKGKNPIVIFSENNTIIDSVINDYLHKPLRKIYYFEGGFSSYKKVDELNKMTAVSNQHKRLSTKKPVSCAN